MGELTKAAVEEAIGGYIDPYLETDLVSAKSVKSVNIDGARVRVAIQLGFPASGYFEALRQALSQRVSEIPGVDECQVDVSVKIATHVVQQGVETLGSVKNIIAVASGKGGVGKSTVAVNLAIALSQSGSRVGLVDADILGPSIPGMLGLPPDELPAVTADGRMVPPERYGVKAASMGLLRNDDNPAILRGPMVSKYLQMLVAQVDWGELDYLILDLPPGTGDTQLTLAQSLRLSGVVIVTTPQDVSLKIARRGLRMFETVNVPILGIVENMVGYAIEGRVEGAPVGAKVTIDTGVRVEELTLDENGRFHTIVNIFGSGGAERLATKHGFPVLGQIPLNPAVRVGGDAGDPITVTDPDSVLAKYFADIAGRFAQRVAIKEHATLPILQ